MITPFFEVGKLGQLRHRSRREVWDAQHHSLDSGIAEITGFEPSRSSAEATMQALNDPVRLRSVGGFKHLREDARRADLATAKTTLI
jgi:hypothetical protein